MQRAPIPTNESEYTLYVFHRADEITGARVTVFTIQTTREFANFRYGLHVEASYSPQSKVFSFTIGGISAPASLLPGTGSAQGVHAYPDLKPGEYFIKVHKGKTETNEFVLHVEKDGLRVTPSPSTSKQFITAAIGESESPAAH